MATNPRSTRTIPPSARRARAARPAPRGGARHRAGAGHQPARAHRDDAARQLPRLARAPPDRDRRARASAVARRIREIGRGRGLLGAAYGVLTTAVGQALVLTKGPLDLLRGGPRGEEKLLKNARDEVVTEALEIAIYDAIEALARAVGDEPTARLAARHRGRRGAHARASCAATSRASPAPSRRRAPGGRPSYDWSDDRRRRRGPLGEPQPQRKATTTRRPRVKKTRAADADYDKLDRQRGRRQAHGPHPGAADADDRLRARPPQARHGDRARAEPAGGRAVQPATTT